MRDVQRMTGATFIAETFVGYGITHVFYMEAILRRSLVEMEKRGIRRVLAHSEKGAAYMADGYARASGRPAVCMAQSVGAANLAAGLQDAYLALSPVIAITGRKPPRSQNRNAYQEVRHAPLFDPVTKYHANVVELTQLPYEIRQAFREATSGSPQPVHLDVLGHRGDDIELAEGRLEVVAEQRFAHYPSFRTEPNEADVQRVARVLSDAERPVIVAGRGVKISSAKPEIQELAEKLSIPVATSLGGKGSIVEDHPLSVGVVGTYSRWCANRVVSEADTVLFVGSRTGDQVTNQWTIPGPETTVIQVDIDSLELGRNYADAIGLVGDPKRALRRLIDALDAQKGERSWAQQAQEWARAWRDDFAPILDSDAVPIRPERLCKEVGEALPVDGVLLSDTGYSGLWTGIATELRASTQSYFRAAGSLGWAFPASLGAKCAMPDRPVICLTGDGGFWYHLSELETARRWGINVVVVVNNNGGFGQCKVGVDDAYGDSAGKRQDLYQFCETGFARLAEDVGCLGIRVERPGGIAAALRRALDADAPAVVEVITDIECAAPTSWVPS